MTLNEQRTQLLRLLAGALLINADDGSSLQAYCALLATDSRIGSDVADLLLPLLERNGKSRFVKQVNPKLDQPVVPAENVFAALQRYGASKSACIEAMKKSNPKFIVPIGIGKMAVKDVVRKFVSQSSSDQITRMLDIVGGDEIDPYLRGIGRTR